MSAAFPPGTVVRLKSGGPKMTVQQENDMDSTLLCTWFNSTEVKRYSFAPESLEVVRNDEDDS